MSEIIDIVDENDNAVRTTTRKEVRENKLLHRSSVVIVFNSEGKMLLQRRAKTKDLWPGTIAMGVGETVKAGETYEEAARRGTKEEIGIEANPKFLFKLKFRAAESNENCGVFTITTDQKPDFNTEEVDEVFFVTQEEAKRLVLRKDFEPLTKAILKQYWKFLTYKPIDEVDEQDNVIGKGSYEEIVEGGRIFMSANILVFNSKGEIFLHKRSRSLPTYPGMWDVKLGGIVDAGETYEEAAMRELEEEAGIKNAKIEFAFTLKYRSGKYNNNRKIYTCRYDGRIKLQEEEIEEGRFAPMEEAIKMSEKKMLSPSAEAILREFLKWKK